MTEVISITNGKGGVGASNSVINIADCLARHTRSTLIFDQDRQADISKLMNLPSGNQAVQYLNRMITADKAVIETGRPGLSLIPANKKIVGVESTMTLQMSQQDNDEDKRALREMIATHIKEAGDNFQTMIIDPPKSGEIQQAAIMAADTLIVPTKLDFASMSNTVSLIKLAVLLINPCVKIIVLPVGLDGRRKAAETEIIGNLTVECMKAAGSYTVKMAAGIPESASVKKAGLQGKTIFEYDPKSSVTVAYNEFCHRHLGL